MRGPTAVRPASAHRERSVATCPANTSRSPAKPIQPSAQPAISAWQPPGVSRQPSRTGTDGRCTGFGHAQLGERLAWSPWNSASVSCHSARISATCSRTIARRLAVSRPWFASSGAFHPYPTPSENRPPEMKSRVAIVFASAIGSCWATSATQVPILRSVRAAMADSATYGSRVRR